MRGYQMSRKEIKNIVDSCIIRRIRFKTIELTGGEVTMWENLEYGVHMFERIADEVTFVTNGNHPERVIALNLPKWIVSASQASKSQLEKYEPYKDRITFNSHKHKKLPTEPVLDSLPALCCLRTDPYGVPQEVFWYALGEVWYCCDAFAHSEYCTDKDIVCKFEEDFISKFSNKTYDKCICQYCLCNRKVWDKI